ncbi:DNA repair protein REV1 isoform X3 [Talpa occidentalis]|nr:DNA repair protein REV1 isoform X3 [Talpa occidentalis]XP_037383854.1 DNA repair protein REV1 isoform X3 [Talpa occidentalis]XP_037383856.1 DNA repair protein REV1 isoform X3 [Talpa occidentalis]XP_054557879.1 DNA repair protein REV1 isoform X3 [Talpa occidentalis]XP_054557880.1 DNA repair protein REV1 isoform X3 [Talpa occidentalis]
MRRGGWRKRAENDGWEKWGGYMAAKVRKLEEQFQSDATMQKDGTSSTIFSGVAIYVNGYTDPSAEELRKLMMLHGGQYHVYYSRSKTTHIIATNLPNAKIKELKGEKVIRPEWIVESIKAGRLLSYIPYQLYSKPSSVQKGLNFNPVCKPEDPEPGPSNIAKQLNNRVNHVIKKIETENEVKVNGMNSWNEEDASDDFSFVELEQIFPKRKQNGIPHHRDSTAIFNGHTHSSNGALKTQDCLVSMANSVASRLSPDPTQEEEKAEKSTTDFRDCIVQQLQQSPRNTDALRNPHRTNSSLSSLHSNTKINGAHHSMVQGPSSTKSTSSVPAGSKAASSVPSKPSDCSFISDFYSHSRLHHISMWKCELTEFVNTLQRQSSGIFPGREKLKKMKTGRSALVVTDTGNMSVLSSPRHQSCIMHVDMDCFFVSVGIRNRPDLKGKPVAVTSNRGTGRAPLRPGTNPQLEWQYYQNKILKGKAADISDSSMWENQDSAQTNGIDSVLSKAEIASCSYEARQVGIKNGMFFGQAKQLCPNLQAVPYDFHAYKEVARMMYETLASYTHNIEAVSCDEALVDITEILAETRLTPDEFANAVRMEIKDQTKCAASVGIGSNILLARMATRKAKPDGQYHLKPEEVDDFIRGQLVTNLPGVGRSMESKLTSLGIRTCGDLQYMTMAKLQREFGPKTGQMLYRFCRGLDDRPVRTEKERKSVSAEINYGIRFTQSKEAEAFLLNLSEEIQRRLEAAGMKGKRLTLKIMVRKPGAPVETAKFGGHGICDNIARTVTLDQATDSAKIIGKATLNMFHTMKLNISDMRGVGIQVNQLVPTNSNTSACPTRPSVQSSHFSAGSHSVLDLFQVQKAKKSTEEEHKEVFLAAMDLEISSASRTCTFLPSFSTHLTSSISPVTSKATESSGKWNGLHPPISLKSRLNLSIEVPSPSQLDQSVLEALPPDLREQVEQACAGQQGEPHGDKKNEPINGCSAGILPQPVGTVLLQIPEPQESNSDTGINVIALPAFSQVDPEVFAALPAELQKELKAAYDQRQRQGETTTHQQSASASVPKNSLLQLKPPAVKEKKRNKKKNPISPQKKTQSPLKNKLLNSPAKTLPGACGSPQKLIDGFLRHDGPIYGPISEKPLGEHCASTSEVPNLSGLQPDLSGSAKPQAPNLAGAVEFSDVKTLLKEWITTISDPMEEDILQVVKYCTDLIEEKDLEKLDLVIKYMKRLMQQSVESVWNMAFDFILDNVQVVLQQTYGSTLKVT